MDLTYCNIQNSDEGALACSSVDFLVDYLKLILNAELETGAL